MSEVSYIIAKRGRPPKAGTINTHEPTETPDTPDTPVPQVDTAVDITLITTDKTLFNKKSPANVKAKLTNELSRREEIEAALVREKGRYIESQDSAKAGVPFSSTRGGAYTPDGASHPFEFAKPSEIAFRAEGVSLGGDIFDTGDGAQKAPVEDISDPTDPRSSNFLACSNGNCQYRMGCLRYRMKNQRTSAIFFPDACRLDGIFIALDDTNFTGYSPIESLELTKTPSF